MTCEALRDAGTAKDNGWGFTTQERQDALHEAPGEAEPKPKPDQGRALWNPVLETMTRRLF